MFEYYENYNFYWGGYGLPPGTKIEVGDIVGDGKQYMAALRRDGAFTIFQWKAETYYPVYEIEFNESFQGLIFADLDGDGVEEIIFSSENYLIVYSYNNQQFRQIARESISKVGVMAAGDFDGDKKLEIAVVSEMRTVKLLKYKNGKLKLLDRITFVDDIQVGAGDVSGNEIDNLVALELSHGPGKDRVYVYEYMEDRLKELAHVNIFVKASKLFRVCEVDDKGFSKIIIGVNNNTRIIILELQGGDITRQWLSHGFPKKIVDVTSGFWGNRYIQLIIAAGEYVYIYQWEGRYFVERKRIEIYQNIDLLNVRDIGYEENDKVFVVTEAGNIVLVRDIFKSKSQFLVTESVAVPTGFPDVLKVAEAKVTSTNIKGRRIINNKVIVSGDFHVLILYVADSDRSVRAVQTKVPFVHFVHVPGVGPGSKVFVEIEVEYTDARFNPARPRTIQVVVIAKVIVYDIVVGRRQTLHELAGYYGVDPDALAEINEISVNSSLVEGERIKLPR